MKLLLQDHDVLFAMHYHPDFGDLDAVDGIDMRPNRRVCKVRPKTNDAEIQVDAMTGEILNQARRNSDMLEQLHDGGLFGDWAHDMLMPLVAVTNIILALGGLYLWLAPKLRKKKSPPSAKVTGSFRRTGAGSTLPRT